MEEPASKKIEIIPGNPPTVDQDPVPMSSWGWPSVILRVLYLENRDQEQLVDTTIGAEPLGSLPHVSAGEGLIGPMPLCLRLQLLQAWRDVPHDGEGRPDGTPFFKNVRGPAISVWRFLHVFGVSAGLFIDACFAGGYIFQPAASETFL